MQHLAAHCNRVVDMCNMLRAIILPLIYKSVQQARGYIARALTSFDIVLMNADLGEPIATLEAES